MTEAYPTSCSIVIRCHNEEKHIGKLLTGIMQQTVRDVEIIIVDSGSTDATVAIASRYPVKVIGIDRSEFSFGRSLNRGCEAATRDYIVIVSAHVYPTAKDWLEQLLRPFADPNIGLTYGKQRGNDSTKYSEHQIFARWFPEEPNPRQSHPFCNNANAAIRRSVWEQIRYNEDLTGLEDLDWAKRAIQSGYSLAYVPGAEIIHVHEETPKRVYNRYRREAIALKGIYPDERFRFLDVVRLFIMNVFTDYYHAWHDRQVIRNLGGIPVFRLMQFWGTYRGFAFRGSVPSTLKSRFYYPNERTRSGTPQRSVRSDRLIDYSSH